MPIKFGNNDISKIYFGENEVSKIYLGQTLVYQAGSEPGPGPSADPILANNSWETIAQVCEAGQASNYWALGDTKTDVGTDGVTRTFRICDMYNAYTGRVVFEQVEVEDTSVIWNINTNTDSDGAWNNYDISDMRHTVLPALLLNYSNDLQGQINVTTYKVAKNGWASPMPILELSDKLFLPAEHELFSARGNSVQDEWDLLTQFDLYQLNSSTFTNKKDHNNQSQRWWERSPSTGTKTNACCVENGGGRTTAPTYQTRWLAPCFTFGPTPTISFTIAGTTYQAEQGMTWAQWVASAYNTAGFVVDSPYILTANGQQYVRDAESTETITDGTAWTLASYGGGD